MRDMPKSEREEPRRLNERSDTDAARCEKSKTDIADDIRAKDRKAIDAPM
jgi:hypothetical protein